MTSRNQREGRYAGKHDGRHIREEPPFRLPLTKGKMTIKQATDWLHKRLQADLERLLFGQPERAPLSYVTFSIPIADYKIEVADPTQEQRDGRSSRTIQISSC